MFEHSVYSEGVVVEEDVVDDTRFRVLFTHTVKRGMSIARIRDKVRRRFNLSEAGVERMFADPPMVVKDDVDVLTAYQYKLAIDDTGATGKIEVMPPIEKQRASAEAMRRVRQLRAKLAAMAARKRQRKAAAELTSAPRTVGRVASAKRLANGKPAQPGPTRTKRAAAPRLRRSTARAVTSA